MEAYMDIIVPAALVTLAIAISAGAATASLSLILFLAQRKT